MSGTAMELATPNSRQIHSRQIAVRALATLALLSAGCRPMTSAGTAQSRGPIAVPDPIPGPEAELRGDVSESSEPGRAADEQHAGGQHVGGAAESRQAVNEVRALSKPDSATTNQRRFQVCVQAAMAGAGTVRVAIFADAESYSRQANPIRTVELEPLGEQCVWQLEDLPAGQYAVAAYQDRNGNGELDKGLLGIPREPYGFSNQPDGKLRPPSFENAKVAYDGAAAEVTVLLRAPGY